jgi:hypothetical protein
MIIANHLSMALITQADSACGDERLFFASVFLTEKS